MHILLLNDDALPATRGGAAIAVDRLRREYARRGHRVTLLTTHQDVSRERAERGGDAVGEIISLFVAYPLRKRHRKCIRNPAVAPLLETLFADLKPDVVHAHNLHTYLTYESLLIARRFTDRIFLTAHDTFLVSFDRVRGAGYERAALRGEGYRMHVWHHLRDAGRKYWPLRNRLIRKMLRKSGTRVIAMSKAAALFLGRNGIPVSEVIPNGVTIPAMPSESAVALFRKRFHLTGPTVLFGGRVSADKGVFALLDAMEDVLKDLPKVSLLLVGEKERITPALRNCSPRLQEAIRLTGWMTQEEMPLAYAAADIVTTPSLYLDSFLMINIEAMSMEKPVVGTCFGATPEIVEHERTGLIMHPRETEKFAEALLRLLRNPTEAKKMGEAGRARAEKHFSLASQTEHYLRLFHSHS